MKYQPHIWDSSTHNDPLGGKVDSLPKAVKVIREDVQKYAKKGLLTNLKAVLNWGNEVYAKELYTRRPEDKDWVKTATYTVEQLDE